MRTRIQDYEQRGVHASLELQQAALKVAWENERLRSLMASKGIARQEIELYLEHCRRGVMTPYLLQDGGHTPSDGMAGSPSTALRSSPQHLSPKSNAQQDIHLIGVEFRLENTLPGATTDTSIDLVPLLVQSISRPHVSCTDNVDPSNAPNETSCEVAATIIASMRWQGDEEEIRIELGCDGRRECTVRNTTVFQIMDVT